MDYLKGKTKADLIAIIEEFKEDYPALQSAKPSMKKDELAALISDTLADVLGQEGPAAGIETAIEAEEVAVEPIDVVDDEIIEAEEPADSDESEELETAKVEAGEAEEEIFADQDVVDEVAVEEVVVEEADLPAETTEEAETKEASVEPTLTSKQPSKAYRRNTGVPSLNSRLPR